MAEHRAGRHHDWSPRCASGGCLQEDSSLSLFATPVNSDNLQKEIHFRSRGHSIESLYFHFSRWGRGRLKIALFYI